MQLTTEVLTRTAIRFPKLGWEISNLPEYINLFGLKISFYGILIACAMLFGLLLTEHLAKRTKQNKEFYLDFAIRAIVAGIIGARTGYVVVRWSEYKNMAAQMFSLRNGGLSFFGAVIAVLIVAYFYCKRKKYSITELCDTMVPGVLLGQLIGRWGDFFNRDMLGSFSDGLLSMQIDVRDVDANLLLMEKAAVVEQNSYLQMHPVFLYEILWNLVLFAGILIYFKHRKFSGEIAYLYLFGYGLMRFLTEFIRLDVIYLGNTKVTGGMAVALIMMLCAATAYSHGMWRYLRENRKKQGKNT